MSSPIIGPAPPGIISGNATAQGTLGQQIIYYTVVTRYPSGIAFPTFTIRALQTAGVSGLDAQHAVAVSWSPMPGATGYDLLRHATPPTRLMSSPCLICGVVLNTPLTEILDIGQGNLPYPPAGLTGVQDVQAQLLVDNTLSVPPSLNVKIGSNEYQLAPTAAGTVTGGPFTAGHVITGNGGSAVQDSGVPIASIPSGGPFAAGNIVEGGGGEVLADSGVALASLATNPMSALGDMIAGGVAGAPTRVVGQITTVQKFLSQTGTGSASAAPSWQVSPAQGFLTYYFTNTNSSPTATYFQATATPFGSAITLSFAALATGTDLLKNWATNAGIPNLSAIPAGVYNMHIHALRTGGGNVTLHAQFWEVDASEVDIGQIGVTEDTPLLLTTQGEYNIAFARSTPYVMASTTSRIVARVFAVVSGSSPTVQIFIGSTADSSIALPSNTVDASNFVPYTGATQDLNLGSHTYTQPKITDFTQADHNHQAAAGGGTLVESALALSDNTTNDASTSQHGFMQKYPGGIVTFLRADGSFAGTLHCVSFTIDGGGSVIASGDIKTYPSVDFAGNIVRIDISADQSGSIAIDVWKAAGAIPTSGNKISASAPITLSTQQLSQAGSLTGWTLPVAVGDVFGFSVQATPSLVTRVVGQIWIQ